MNPPSSLTARVALVFAVLLALEAPRAADQSDIAGPVIDAAEPGASEQPAARGGRRAIFVCHEANGTVFSDRPCNAVADRRELALDTSAGRASSTIPRTATATPLPRKARPAEPPGDSDDGLCSRLRGQLDRLDDRMRAGYSASESARLWQQWRELKSLIRERRC